jgi:arsenate reductase
MAEGILRHLGGNDYEAFSAGIKPTPVHPMAIKVMAEIGIDISSQRSKSIDEYRNLDFDFVITVCDSAKAICPIFLRGVHQIHWSFIDPAEVKGTEDARLLVFRNVRDQIMEKIKEQFVKGEK